MSCRLCLSRFLSVSRLVPHFSSVSHLHLVLSSHSPPPLVPSRVSCSVSRLCPVPCSCRVSSMFVSRVSFPVYGLAVHTFHRSRLVSRVSCLVSRFPIVSHLMSHVLRLVSLFSCLVYLVYCVSFPDGIPSHVLCILSRVSVFMYCVSCICPHVSYRVSCHVSVCVLSRASCLVSQVLRLVSLSSCLVSRISCLVSRVQV